MGDADPVERNCAVGDDGEFAQFDVFCCSDDVTCAFRLVGCWGDEDACNRMLKQTVECFKANQIAI